MAFINFYTAVNQVLVNAGEDPFTSTGQFDGATSGYGKAQLQCKSYMQKAHLRAMQRGHFRYLRSQMTLTTSSASNVYALTDTGVSPPVPFNAEDIIIGSMINTTVGQGTGGLYPIDYDDWLRQFPAGEVSKGVPFRYFVYPPHGSDGDTIGFSPPPVGTYTINLEYNLPPVQLVTSTDLIQIRNRDLYVLLDSCQMWLEISKSEGKAPDFATQAELMFEELRQSNLGDPTKPPHVVFLMGKLGFRKSLRISTRGGNQIHGVDYWNSGEHPGY